MVDGWKPIVIAEEIFDKLKEHYNDNKEDLKLKEGVRSLTGYVGFLLRETMKEKKII